MATYPNVNAANQYARDIVGGKILACQLTILACKRHLDDLERAKDPNWPYRFDKNKAERFLRFAQKNATYRRGMGPPKTQDRI